MFTAAGKWKFRGGPNATPFVVLGLSWTLCAHGASFQGVGDLPCGYVYSIAQGVSADGLFVVGSSYSSNGYEPFRWTVQQDFA